MTAQVFLDVLRHAFFSIDRCNLMIFDECHHATSNHPYNCIMKEFYFSARTQDRPKILGRFENMSNLNLKMTITNVYKQC